INRVENYREHEDFSHRLPSAAKPLATVLRVRKQPPEIWRPIFASVPNAVAHAEDECHSRLHQHAEVHGAADAPCEIFEHSREGIEVHHRRLFPVERFWHLVRETKCGDITKASPHLLRRATSTNTGFLTGTNTGG